MQIMFKPVRILFALLLPLLSLAIDVQVAYAQANNCSRLSGTLNSLNRNREFRSLERNSISAREIAKEVQDMESLFVRGGCQKLLADGARLSRQCRTVARRITRGRKEYNDLAAKIQTGQAVAQQRELALQQVARFGCGSGSNARITINTRQQNGVQNLFDRLFGFEGDIRYDNYYGFENLSTLRTVCVRSCDGYYWPVSFSTLDQFLPEDAGRCQAQCPGAEVNLFYYRNPGEDADDMINLSGEPYRSTPNAFRYRQEFDRSCSCSQQISYGTIELATSETGENSRAMVTFEDAKFPLPIRDPRRETNPKIVAVTIIPLPRPRPLQEGETPPVVAVPQSTIAETDVRKFQYGQRTVRIVGPDTPYAQSTAAGS